LLVSSQSIEKERGEMELRKEKRGKGTVLLISRTAQKEKGGDVASTTDSIMLRKGKESAMQGGGKGGILRLSFFRHIQGMKKKRGRRKVEIVV